MFSKVWPTFKFVIISLENKLLNRILKINKLKPNITTSEADIKTTLLSDKFIVINIVQNQEFFNVRYQVKPFMLWIWISVILISFGGLISFLKKGYEK